MSTPGNSRTKTPLTSPTIPRGETVARYDSYELARRAVDLLGKSEFPVARVSIVGEGLKSVESVTGMMSYGKAALNGLMSGAWLGIFLGLMLVIMNPALNLAAAGAAVLIGAGFGMLFSIVNYSVRKRSKDFTSVMQVVATDYVLIVDPEIAGSARRILGTEADPATT